MLRDIKGATGQRPCHGTVVLHRGNRPCDGTSSSMPGQRSGYGAMCQYGRTARHYGTIDRVRAIWSGTGNWAPYGMMACTGKHAATGNAYAYGPMCQYGRIALCYGILWSLTGDYPRTGQVPSTGSIPCFDQPGVSPVFARRFPGVSFH